MKNFMVEFILDDSNGRQLVSFEMRGESEQDVIDETKSVLAIDGTLSVPADGNTVVFMDGMGRILGLALQFRAYELSTES